MSKGRTLIVEDNAVYPHAPRPPLDPELRIKLGKAAVAEIFQAAGDKATRDDFPHILQNTALLVLAGVVALLGSMIGLIVIQQRFGG